MKCLKALATYFENNTNARDAETAAIDFKKTFDATMDGAAMLLDLVGEINYVYTTKSGNKIRGRLDSP